MDTRMQKVEFFLIKLMDARLWKCKKKKTPLKLKVILKVSVMSLMKSTSVVKNAKIK